jgi:hypothetical protein
VDGLRLGALRADGAFLALMVQLTPVVHEEARHAGEFIRLLGDDANSEVLVGQVGAREFEGLG